MLITLLYLLPAANNLMQERMEFLKKDLDNLFNDRGVDQSQYDDQVNFMDPITKYSSVKGKHKRQEADRNSSVKFDRDPPYVAPKDLPFRVTLSCCCLQDTCSILAC